MTGRLSIPAWFDWRPCPAGLLACCVTPFQSQLGSIGAQGGGVGHHGPAPPLSIPAWFDWRTDPRNIIVGWHRPFNPSLVRLALMPRLPSACGFHSFNPSLVRLAPRIDPLYGKIKPPFNPSLVRLAPPWWPGALGRYRSRLSIPAWFDWRPRTVSMISVRASVFQSQLGSIGAIATFCCRPPGGHTFNPSLVRLAHASLFPPQFRGVPFNPSLVRLAPNRHPVLGISAIHFQSQLGSIGARRSPEATL